MKRDIDQFVESMEGSSAEGRMEFDETDCCALDRAFEQNTEVTRRWEDIVDNDENMAAFRKMLKDAEEIKFIPDDKMKMACSQIAKRELERIDAEGSGDESLICRHSLAEHVESLQNIVQEMGPTIH